MDNSNLGIGQNPITDPLQENDPFNIGSIIPNEENKAESDIKDLDIDTFLKENVETVKLNQNTDLENGAKPKSEEKTEPSRVEKLGRFMSVEYFRNSFNINTEDVGERIKFALFPFKTGGLFQNKAYDLYGPLWILLTLVFTTSIFGSAFMNSENMNKEKATSVSIHQIGKSFVLSMIYLLINPLIVYYYYLREGARSAQYLEIVSIYGYSFAILPIIEVLILIPIGWFSL